MPEGGGGSRALSEHAHRLSPHAQGRAPPRLRTLAHHLSDPDAIWLAGGLPNGGAFPFVRVSATAADGTEVEISSPEDVYACQQYGMKGEGYPPLVEWVRDHVREMHEPPYGEWDVLVTCGNADATGKAFDLVLGPGDALLVDEANFPASVSSLGSHVSAGVVVLPVAADPATGAPSLAALRAAHAEALARGAAPKMLYTVPTAQNPSGRAPARAAVQAVYAACCDLDLVICEDDPYFYLWFGGGGWRGRAGDAPAMPGLEGLAGACVPTYLSADVEGRVVRLDTFSKFVAPGLRCGWITAPRALHRRLVMHTQTTTQGASPMTSMMLHKLLSAWGRDGLDAHLRRLQADYSRRAGVLLDAVDEHLGAHGLAEYAEPAGGMFAWVHVVGAGDTRALMPALVDRGVILVPGAFFLIDGEPDGEPDPAAQGAGDPRAHFRACFATATDEAMVEGVKRLAQVVREARAGDKAEPPGPPPAAA